MQLQYASNNDIISFPSSFSTRDGSSRENHLCIAQHNGDVEYVIVFIPKCLDVLPKWEFLQLVKLTPLFMDVDKDRVQKELLDKKDNQSTFEAFKGDSFQSLPISSLALTLHAVQHPSQSSIPRGLECLTMTEHRNYCNALKQYNGRSVGQSLIKSCTHFLANGHCMLIGNTYSLTISWLLVTPTFLEKGHVVLTFKNVGHHITLEKIVINLTHFFEKEASNLSHSFAKMVTGHTNNLESQVVCNSNFPEREAEYYTHICMSKLDHSISFQMGEMSDHTKNWSYMPFSHDLLNRKHNRQHGWSGQPANHLVPWDSPDITQCSEYSQSHNAIYQTAFKEHNGQYSKLFHALYQPSINSSCHNLWQMSMKNESEKVEFIHQTLKPLPQPPKLAINNTNQLTSIDGGPNDKDTNGQHIQPKVPETTKMKNRIIVPVFSSLRPSQSLIISNFLRLVMFCNFIKFGHGSDTPNSPIAHQCPEVVLLFTIFLFLTIFFLMALRHYCKNVRRDYSPLAQPQPGSTSEGEFVIPFSSNIANVYHETENPDTRLASFRSKWKLPESPNSTKPKQEGLNPRNESKPKEEFTRKFVEEYNQKISYEASLGSNFSASIGKEVEEVSRSSTSSSLLCHSSHTTKGTNLRPSSGSDSTVDGSNCYRRKLVGQPVQPNSSCSSTSQISCESDGQRSLEHSRRSSESCLVEKCDLSRAKTIVSDYKQEINTQDANGEHKDIFWPSLPEKSKYLLSQSELVGLPHLTGSRSTLHSNNGTSESKIDGAMCSNSVAILYADDPRARETDVVPDHESLVLSGDSVSEAYLSFQQDQPAERFDDTLVLENEFIKPFPIQLGQGSDDKLQDNFHRKPP